MASSSLFDLSKTQDSHNVCTHLTLGACPCTTKGTTMFSNKRKSSSSSKVDDDDARKRRCRTGKEPAQPRSWGCSTDLVLFKDPWKIKKKLTLSDVGSLSRLMLSKDLAQDLVLPVLSPDAKEDARNQKGTKILIWDMDTQSSHYLMFKLWKSSDCYIFLNTWTRDFVKRRGLKKDDEIKLHWDPDKNCFDFSVNYA